MVQEISRDSLRTIYGRMKRKMSETRNDFTQARFISMGKEISVGPGSPPQLEDIIRTRIKDGISFPNLQASEDPSMAVSGSSNNRSAVPNRTAHGDKLEDRCCACW